MTKRIISMALATSFLILPCIGSIGLAAEIGAADCIYYDDFENFDASAYTNVTDGKYSIGTDNTKYLSVKTGHGVAEGFPTKSLSATGSVVLEFDVKTTGSGAKIYATFDNGAQQELFCMLADGRGPLIRNDADIPHFFYKSGDSIPAFGDWNHILININMETGEMTAQCNGNDVKLYDREYNEQPSAKIAGKSLTSLTFSSIQTDISDSANSCYDNVKLYAAGTQGTGGTDPGTDPVEPVITEDYTHNRNMAKLNALSIIPEQIASFNREDTLTRAQFTMMAMKSIGAEQGYAAENSFSDISDATVAAYVNMAVNMGAVSGNGDGTFDPDRMISLNEAVKIMTCLLGYAPKANKSGGYPAGYMIVANSEKLLDGINMVSGNQLVNLKDAATLVSNSLTTPMMRRISYGGEETYSNSDKSITLLSVYHKLTEIEREIVDANAETKRIRVVETNSGEQPVLMDVASSVSLTGIEGTRQYLWVDEDNMVTYMYPYKQYKIVYGYVSEYNDEETTGLVRVSEIDSLAFSNFTGEVSVDSEFVLKMNGTALDEADEVNLIGAFGRAVLAENAVQQFDIIGHYDTNTNTQTERPREGGLVKSVDSTTLRYIAGTNSVAAIENLDTYDKIVSVLDGTEVELSAIQADMLFDYAVVGSNKEKLVLIASSHKYSGTLEEFSSDSMTVGDTVVPVTSQTIYVSTDNGEEYEDDYDVYNAIGVDVTVYTDMAGAVRYMITDPSESEFYGVVTGAKQDNVLDDSDAYLRVAKLNSSLEEKEYLVDLPDRTLYYPEIDFETAASNSRKTDGSGVYKFTTNGDTITMITAIDWLKDDGESETLKVANGDYGFDYRAVRINVSNTMPTGFGKYVPVAQDGIFVLQDYEGEFELQAVPWNTLKQKKGSCSFRASVPDPVSEVVILFGTVSALEAGGANYGFITSETKVMQDDEQYTKFELTKNGAPTEYLIKNDYVSTANLGLYDYVYAEAAPLLYPNDIQLKAVDNIPLSDPKSWIDAKEPAGKVAGQLTFKYIGVYEGMKEGHVKGQLNGETNWSTLNATYGVFSTNSAHSRYKTGTLEEAVGKECYVMMVGELVRDIFYID